VTLQVLSSVLLICLGLLIGSTWTIQALQPKLGREAEERRRLNEEWVAVRTASWQRSHCPRCGIALGERHWSAVVEDPPDED
jgi:sulfite exporter TauE/SafE